MWVLANSCNILFVFDPLAPLLAYCKNVDASNDNGCIGIVVLMLKQD